MRENAEAKGRRYLVEGRLVLRRVSATQVDGTCRGNGRMWRVSYRRGQWSCTCPARTQCSHLVAACLVVAINPAVRVRP